MPFFILQGLSAATPPGREWCLSARVPVPWPEVAGAGDGQGPGGSGGWAAQLSALTALAGPLVGSWRF
jgi:hypothetical protein